MKRKALRKFLLFLGLCPFVLPFLWWFYQRFVDPWPMLVWLMLYSYLYWPGYVAGLALILSSLFLRKK